MVAVVSALVNWERRYVGLRESVGMACRSSDVIELSDEERAELAAMSGRLTAPFRAMQRARIVLYAAQASWMQQVAQVKAVAWELPSELGVPISRLLAG